MKTWFKFSLAAICLLLTVLIYESPHIYRASEGYSGVALLDEDESWYQARLMRFLQGNFKASNPWTHEDQEVLSLVPDPIEKIIASLALSLGATAESAPHTVGFIFEAARIFFLSLSFLSLMFFMSSIGANLLAATLASLWIFIEPGLLTYSPFLTWFEPHAGLPYNRFITPLASLPLYFLGLSLSFKLLLAEEKRGPKGPVILGILIGIQAYITPFYWIATVVNLTIGAFVVYGKRGFRFLMPTGITTIFAASLYLLKQTHLKAAPNYEVTTWANWLLVRERQFWLLPNKKLWIFFFVISFLLWVIGRKTPGFKKLGLLLWLNVCGILFCLFSSIFIGISISNFHWHYAASLQFAIALTWSLIMLIQNSNYLVGKKIGVALCCLALAISLASGARSMRNLYLNTYEGIEEEAIWKWLRTNAPSEAVVLANSKLMQKIPARSGQSVWFTNSLSINLVDRISLMPRNLFLWKLNAATLPEMTKELNIGIPMWPRGITQNRLELLKSTHFPLIDQTLLRELIQESFQVLQTTNDDDLLKSLRKLKLDFVIMGPKEAHWREQLSKFIKAEPVYSSQTTQILQVIGWK